jgi:thiol-disulfide isomerase/thioredoxin
MKYFIAFLLTLDVAFSQQFIVTERPRPFVVTDYPAAFIVDARTPECQTAKSRKTFLAFFTATYCGPCQSWKKKNKAAIESKGYVIREIEMTVSENKERYKKKVSSFPTFVVCDYETGEWLSDPVVGGVSPETIYKLMEVWRVGDPKPESGAVERYYKYHGSTYDLETYGGCSMRSCGMCAEIRAAQKRYRDSRKVTGSVGPQSSSPKDVIIEALSIMKLNSESVFCDLGCGDGSVMIEAARQTGCHCIGVEIDPIKVNAARRMIAGHGLSSKIQVIQGDVRDFDPSRHQVTHVYAYLYEDLLKEISAKLASVPISVCPGHECPGIGMRLIGQCWVRGV